MTAHASLRATFFLGWLLGTTCLPALAIDSVFTYQGRLNDSTQGGPATGLYDLEFTLQDTGGATVGSPLVVEDASVVDGVFTVQLDFGPTAFTGPNRFLQIGVRRGDETGVFTALTPRTTITPTPYAQTSSAAGFAATVANNSVGSAQIVNASVGEADIDATVQRRVTGACSSGSAIASVSATGTVSCETIPAPGGGSLIPFASGAGDFVITTSAGGTEGVGLMMGFGGAELTDADVSSPNLDTTSEGNFAFVTPRNGTLTAISLHISTTTFLNLIGTAVVVQAKVYVASAGSNLFTAVPGSVVVASPSLTGIVAPGTTASGGLTGLSIPVAQDHRLLLVVSAQAFGVAPIQSIGVRASGGMEIR